MIKIIIVNNTIIKFTLFLAFFLLIFYFYFKNNTISKFKKRSLYGQSMLFKIFVLIIIGILGSIWYIIREFIKE